MTKYELNKLFGNAQREDIFDGVEELGIDLDNVKSVHLYEDIDDVVDSYIKSVGGCNPTLVKYLNYGVIFADLQSSGLYYRGYDWIVEYVLF